MIFWFSARLLLVLLLLRAPLQAQPAAATPFTSEVDAARHKAAFVAAACAAGYTSRPEFFYRNRLDITKTKQLLRTGADLHAMDRQLLIDGSYGYQEEALYSDVVVRGTVTEEIGDSSQRVCYHTAFKVKVAEVWQGHLATETVTVKVANGPVGNGVRMFVGGSARFKLGQEVILYLNYVDLAGFAEAEKLGLNSCTNNVAPDDFQASKVLIVQPNGFLDDDYRRLTGLTVATVREAVKTISAILDKEHFYQKAF